MTAKGIIFGFILDKEIDYKITNDIANYNYNTLDGEVHNINAWGRNYLGKICGICYPSLSRL